MCIFVNIIKFIQTTFSSLKFYTTKSISVQVLKVAYTINFLKVLNPTEKYF